MVFEEIEGIVIFGAVEDDIVGCIVVFVVIKFALIIGDDVIVRVSVWLVSFKSVVAAD